MKTTVLGSQSTVASCPLSRVPSEPSSTEGPSAPPGHLTWALLVTLSLSHRAFGGSHPSESTHLFRTQPRE